MGALHRAGTGPRSYNQSSRSSWNGRGIPDRNQIGERIVDDSFLLLINAHHEPVTFTLPSESYGRGWEIVLDTADPLLAGIGRRHPLPGGRQRIPARAMRVLQCRLPT